MKTRFRLLFFIILLAALLAGDRLTKIWARQHLSGKGVYSYFHDTVRLVYTENTGAFLSLGADLPATISYTVFVILPVVFLLLFAVYIILKRYQLGFFTFFCYTLILAGGLGNVIDRIVYHMRVSDFLNFGIGNLRTGILNLADFYITSGIVMILIFSFFQNKKDTPPADPS